MIVHTTSGRFDAHADGTTTIASSVEKETAEWLKIQRRFDYKGRLYEIDPVTRVVGRRLASDEIVDPDKEYAYVTDQPVDA